MKKNIGCNVTFCIKKCQQILLLLRNYLSIWKKLLLNNTSFLIIIIIYKIKRALQNPKENIKRREKINDEISITNLFDLTLGGMERKRFTNSWWNVSRAYH